MHTIAYMALLFSMLVSLGAAGLACYQAMAGGEPKNLGVMHKAHLIQTGAITLASAILFYALASHDFSFLYVAEYTDITLPMFYKLTAFWAGQAGSLLFWAWMAAILGAVFIFTPGYKSMPAKVQNYYWLFFLAIMAFFLLLLTSWSNPFTQLLPPPPDGNGLNPLLQHPGMIFHPPLLFLGYAGYAIPGCLALAWVMAGDPDQKPSWLDASYNINLLSWTFLTAGILLGGWWSYMELGWGGYWAWDPVENASLIPWLTATAFLHTAVTERRRGTLHRANLFLMALTLLACFFGTYLVRSGVVDSLHAFGGGGIGAPLLLFILVGLALSIFIVLTMTRTDDREPGGLFTREGFLVMAVWLLLALGGIILAGSLWPVISKLWSDSPVGLGPDFYNRVCLPVFTLLGLFLAACPWLGWKGGFRHGKAVYLVAGVFLGAVVLMVLLGFGNPVALAAFAAGVSSVVGIALLFVLDPAMRGMRRNWGVYGVHVGLAMVILGVALSGPYKVEKDGFLAKGETMTIGDYSFTYEDLREGETPNMRFIEADLRASKDGKDLGVLQPERRVYRNFRDPFAEASTIPSLGTELYATLLAVDKDDKITIKISAHPLVNWIWIGGVLMCFFPFLALARLRRR